MTMACKSHLRNGRPIVIAISTNDALGTNAKNIGELLNRKNIYFVPFRQDDPQGKPNSMISDLSLLKDMYRITHVQPIDMFPHTYHVENVVRLERV